MNRKFCVCNVACAFYGIDEPPANHYFCRTNHLDLNAVIWLDEYLQKWKKTLFVVSHDQDFLNSVCQEILHIEDLQLVSYKGNYDSFKKAEHIKFGQKIKAYEKQEKRLRELKKSGYSREKAIETVKKTLQRETGKASKKKKDQAIAAGTETAELAELLARPREYQVTFEFTEVQELTRPVIEVNNVHFRYSPKHPVIFDCVDFGIDMDRYVAQSNSVEANVSLECSST
jgi:ATP-binding cassette subfamily F protein 1